MSTEERAATEAAPRASMHAGAVFLSYASEDVSAAERIATALRDAGVEVWFDKSELRGGDAWDRSIRQQIRECHLFLPVISAHSDARREGYFRREWKLAVDRTHDMSERVSFLVPVVIDDTKESQADVPDRFREVQWTRLRGGETSQLFVDRVKRLLGPKGFAGSHSAHERTGTTFVSSGRRPNALLYATIAVAVLLALGYVVLERLNRSKPSIAGAASIAVLPLANESGEASQQYFSDGISEDLITALSQFQGLKVIGRTSSFQFRDSKEDSRSIGTKLGVAHLLEGSVRRSGEMVRVSTELIDTGDGSTQWSERYDRPYKDLFALQDEITRTVAGALRTKLLPGEHSAAQSERPPGGSLEAYKAVQEGKYYFARDTEADNRKAIERFGLATRLDARYALAWSLLSRSWTWLGARYLDVASAKEAFANARAATNTALELAPNLASAHLARGRLLQLADLDWRGAEVEFRRALELAPTDVYAKFYLADVLATLGQVNEAIRLSREALATEPLDSGWYAALANYLTGLNRLDEAEDAVRKAIALQPGGGGYYAGLAEIEILRGNAAAAFAAAQKDPERFQRDIALAAARQIGGDRAAADVALKEVIDKYGTVSPYLVAWIYAIRRDPKKTFEWLDQAWSVHDSTIGQLLIDPIILRYKDDPRFAAFCRKVGLPAPGEPRKQT